MKSRLTLLATYLLLGFMPTFAQLPHEADSLIVPKEELPFVEHRALEGRVAGVSVQNQSGTFGVIPLIHVRAASSFLNSNQPLWVIDGMIMENVTEVSDNVLTSGNVETLLSSPIAGLNVEDIESVEVLKEGAATTLYGARGIAGVIVIQTKKGRAGADRPYRINYTGEFSMRLKPSYGSFNQMDSREQMDMFQEMRVKGYFNSSNIFNYPNIGIFGELNNLILTGSLPNTEAALNEFLQGAGARNTDWFDLLFSNSVTQNHTVSFSQATGKAGYYASLSAMYDPGWSKRSKVSRYTADLNAHWNIGKKVSVQLTGYGAYRQQDAPNTLPLRTYAVQGEQYHPIDINPFNFALNTSRTLDPNQYYVRDGAPINIFNELAHNYVDLNMLNLRFSGQLKWKPAKGLEVTAFAAYQYAKSTVKSHIGDFTNQGWAYHRAAYDEEYYKAAANDPYYKRNEWESVRPWDFTQPDLVNTLPSFVTPTGGFHNEDVYTMDSYSLRGTVNYVTTWNDVHTLNLFGGVEFNKTAYNHRLENNEWKADLEDKRPAAYGSATYSYKGRYTLNGSLRYEQTDRTRSALSKDWLPSWSVAGKWTASRETWFEPLSNVLSLLEVTASYSSTPRRLALQTYAYSPTSAYNTWTPTTSDTGTTLYITDSSTAKGLTYEKQKEWNIGVQLGLLKNRINIAFDWYRRNNDDLLSPVITQGWDGEFIKYDNVGAMRADGIELTLATTNILTRTFRWNSYLTFAKTNSKVTKRVNIDRVVDMVTGNSVGMEGDPFRSLYSIDFRGLNADGLPTFMNNDGETTVTDVYFQENRNLSHLVREGTIDPTITGGFGNTFSYGGWKLNVFLTYAFGNVVRLNPAFSNRYNDFYGATRELINRWSLPGDELKTNIPVIPTDRQNDHNAQLSYAYNAYNYSTARIAKGDFIRMKELSLEYNFPKRWMQKLSLSTLSLKLQGTNLFLLYADKKLKGQDPEFANMGGVALPVPKQFTLTVRVGI
jgi:TonB-linked SusC/RagA family outer membrane protein